MYDSILTFDAVEVSIRNCSRVGHDALINAGRVPKLGRHALYLTKLKHFSPTSSSLPSKGTEHAGSAKLEGMPAVHHKPQSQNGSLPCVTGMVSPEKAYEDMLYVDNGKAYASLGVSA